MVKLFERDLKQLIHPVSWTGTYLDVCFLTIVKVFLRKFLLVIPFWKIALILNIILITRSKRSSLGGVIFFLITGKKKEGE